MRSSLRVMSDQSPHSGEDNSLHSWSLKMSCFRINIPKLTSYHSHNLSNRGPHNGEDNSLLSWSLLDEIVWDEFGENIDHIVPEEKLLKQILWPSQNEERNMFRQPPLNVSNLAYSGQSSDKSVATMWNGFDGSSFPSTINSHLLPPKQEKDSGVLSFKETSGIKLETDNQKFQDMDKICNGYDDTETGTGGFPFDDVGSPGRNFNLFSGHQEDVESDSLIELGWDNSNSLEDMDTLFQGSNTVLPQSEIADAMLWPSCPPMSGSSLQAEERSQSREFGCTLKEGNTNVAFRTYDCQSHSLSTEREIETRVSEQNVSKGLAKKSRCRISHHKHFQKHSTRVGFKDNMGFKTEDDVKFCLPMNNHGPSFTPNSSSLLQHLLQPSPFCVRYLQPCFDPPCRQVVSMEMPLQFPSMGTTMSKVTVEHQPKRLLDHKLLCIEECSSKETKNGGEDTDARSSGDTDGRCAGEILIKDDEDVQAHALRQCQSTMANLETRTKVCIRDALYRLAESSIKRRAISSNGNSILDSQSTESSVNTSEEETLLSQRLVEQNPVETDTNSIDRSIVYLLFHKQFLPSPLSPLQGNQDA